MLVQPAWLTGSPGGNSVWVPPDPIPNSEVKPFSADDSVGPPHVKVGHRRGLLRKAATRLRVAAFFLYNQAKRIVWGDVELRPRIRLSLLIPVLISAGCTEEHDSCEDLKGEPTDIEYQLTGILDTRVVRLFSSDGKSVVEAVDQFTEIDIGELFLVVDMSWTAEEFRFDAPSRFLQSLVYALVPNAHACSFAGYTESYKPSVTIIDIISDADLGPDYPVGTSLASVFGQHESGHRTLTQWLNSGAGVSRKSYNLIASWNDGIAASSNTTLLHRFTSSSRDSAFLMFFHPPARTVPEWILWVESTSHRRVGINPQKCNIPHL